MKILIVEDMLPMQAEIASRLALTGLPIAALLYAADLHEAGNQAVAHRPDLVLFDLGLPDSTPEQSVACLRQFTNRFPVVVLSGQKEGIYWRPCILAGAMDYLPKLPYLSAGNEGFLGHALLNAVFRYSDATP